MKKIFITLFSILICCLTVIGASGCSYISNCIIDWHNRKTYAYLNDFIAEGDFVYYLDETTDTYCIVGTTEQGLKDVIYMPTHFRGKEVWRTEYTRVLSFMSTESYSMDVGNCEKLYLNYMHQECSDVGDRIYYTGKVNYVYFVNGDYPIILYELIQSSRSHTGYVSPPAYDKFKYFNKYVNIIEVNNYKFNAGYGLNVIKCNTSYMFNYEDAPNEGYFFVNDFGRGGLIEDTPYKPVRSGYTFAGWYKEPECLTTWNFGSDRLPVAEYDETGELIYVETQLFAKWIKS